MADRALVVTGGTEGDPPELALIAEEVKLTKRTTSILGYSGIQQSFREGG